MLLSITLIGDNSMSNQNRDLFYEMSKQNLKEVSCVSEKNQIISLFAGAGGMDIGFEKAGFKTVWANEYDRSIAPSYQKYFKSVAFDGRSIRNIPDADIPEHVHGVIGGPPCQSWSEAGARRGIADPRGELFFEYLRVIKRAKPSFFVPENVHSLIHARNIDRRCPPHLV